MAYFLLVHYPLVSPQYEFISQVCVCVCVRGLGGFLVFVLLVIYLCLLAGWVGVVFWVLGFFFGVLFFLFKLSFFSKLGS